MYTTKHSSHFKLRSTKLTHRRFYTRKVLRNGYIKGMDLYIEQNEKKMEPEEAVAMLKKHGRGEVDELNEAIKDGNIYEVFDELGDVLACYTKAYCFKYLPQEKWNHPLFLVLLYYVSLNASKKYASRYLENGCIRSKRNCICERCGKKTNTHWCTSTKATADGYCNCP